MFSIGSVASRCSPSTSVSVTRAAQSRATPRLSNPGPRFAEVAGTRTVTLRPLPCGGVASGMASVYRRAFLAETGAPRAHGRRRRPAAVLPPARRYTGLPDVHRCTAAPALHRSAAPGTAFDGDRMEDV